MSSRVESLRQGLLLLIVVSVVGCNGSSISGKKDPAPIDSSGHSKNAIFADIIDSTDIPFVHSVGDERDFFMPRCVGSGVALFDYDGDGKLDMYFLQNAGPGSGVKNKLYRQDGSLKFTDVSEGSGLDVDGHGMGVATGDVNNDGRLDVLITEYGNARLLLNQSNGAKPQFQDVTAASGIENTVWGTSSCFIDYDRDGWLDIVLVNYTNYDPTRWCGDGTSRQDFCGPDAFNGRVTKLLHNLGSPDGRFEDVTIVSGLGERPGPGLGVFCADFDGDRWPDIFIANDGKPNHLWMNQRNGKFKEEAVIRGLGYNSMGKSEADMGIAIGDVNNDGNFDIFVTHLTTETHTLWQQGPRGVFQDTTATSGLTSTSWRGTGFGTVMVDLDNDGDLDLSLANGRVTRVSGPDPKTPEGLGKFWVPYCERDQIMLNNGKGTFSDASPENDDFSGLASVSRGMACGDLDNDGAIDLVVTKIAGPPGVYRNIGSKGKHWLLVKATIPELNREAFGAEVYVNAGGKRMMRWINPGYSFLCSNDSRAHFGLGDINTVDSVEVVWPDGTMERFEGGPVDRQVHLEQGNGKPMSAERASS